MSTQEASGVRPPSTRPGCPSRFRNWPESLLAPVRGDSPAEADGPLAVLVVEDNEDGGETLGQLLQLHGHQAWVTRGGREALGAAAAIPPDVVFLDLQMPGLDGWEVAKRLRPRRGVRRPLLVAVTGRDREEDRRRSSEAGIDVHLVKPADPQEVLAVLARFAPRRTHVGGPLPPPVVRQTDAALPPPGPRRG